MGSLSLEMFKAQPDTPKQADAAMSLVLPGEGLLWDLQWSLPTQTDLLIFAAGSHFVL